MRYAQTRQYDVANGEGVRTTLFVTGCTHNCFNCFNKEYQDFNYGKPFTQKTIDTILEYVGSPHIQGLSLLGGEPMQNTEGLIELCKQFRAKFGYSKDIWCWTGYTFDGVIKHPNMHELLTYIDVLVDGLYIERLKDLTLKFRGSSNQRIIDVKESLIKGEVVHYNI